MAGMFYSLREAAEKLNISEDQLKELAHEGKLREFRDGPNLLFKVDEVEALIPQVEEFEPDVAEPEASEVEMAEPEPQAEEEEPVELDLSDTEVPQAKAQEPEAEISEPEAPEEEISELEALSEEEVPSLEALEAEMAEMEEPAAELPEEEPTPEALEAEAQGPEAPKPSDSAADSEEILLAPETGSPLASGDLTDADTALTGLGTSVLGETDRDYAVTDDTMAETAVPTAPTGTTPEVPLEEIEQDANLDTFGSGSGLLDLSLQADDTSLGGILDEIYTAEEESKGVAEAEGDSAAAVAAEADQMVPEEEIATPQAVPEMGAIAGPMIEVAPDTQSNTLGMLLFLPLLIVIYTTVVAVAGLREVVPSILVYIQDFIWYIMGGAALIAALVVVAAFMFTGERSAAVPKEKKVKVKKEEKAPKEPKKPKEEKPKESKEPKKAKKGFLGRK
jgi:excisionase family DNA binding protein